MQGKDLRKKWKRRGQGSEVKGAAEMKERGGIRTLLLEEDMRVCEATYTKR